MIIWVNSIKVKLAFIIAIFFTLVILVYILLIPKQVKTYSDNILSVEACKIIQDLVLSQDLKRLNPKDLYNCLNQELNYIDEVNISYLANRSALVRIISEKPLLLINNIYALTSKAKLVDISIFKEDSLASLNNINIENLQNLNIKELFSNLKELAKSFYSSYKIKLVDKNYIILVNDKFKNLIIVINAQKLDGDLIRKAEELYLQKGENKKVKIDLRFDDRMIFSHLRGVDYEEIHKI